MLLGITLRGIAFVFRHYDAYKDQSQIVYDWMFKISSIVTPIFLGICFGALLSGRIDLYAEGTTQDFKGLYIEGWLNGFSILVGIGFVTLSYGYAKNIPFVRVFVLNELSVLPVITSGFLLYPLWVSIKRGMRIYSRFFAGLQVLLILLAAVLPIFPKKSFKMIKILEH